MLCSNDSSVSASSKECLKGHMGAQETSDVDLAVYLAISLIVGVFDRKSVPKPLR